MTRMASLVLAFGFFISCTGQRELLTENVEQTETAVLLEQSQELLRDDPGSADGHYMAGVAAYRQAVAETAPYRQDFYELMVTSFDKARQNYDNRSPALDHMHSLQQTAWSQEFARAQATQTDPEASGLTTVHAQNAITLYPDSVQVHLLLSEIYLEQRDLEQAATYLFPVVQSGDRYGAYYERFAYLQTRNGNYDEAGSWYLRSIDWMKSFQSQSLSPADNPAQRGSLLNAYHGAINTLSEAGNTELAISLLNELTTAMDEAGPYHEMLIVQHLYLIRNAALDTYTEFSAPAVEDAMYSIRLSTEAYPELRPFAANEYIDLASAYIDLQTELNDSYQISQSQTVGLFLEEARYYYQAMLDAFPGNEEALYGMAATYNLTGNTDQAEAWLEQVNP